MYEYKPKAFYTKVYLLNSWGPTVHFSSDMEPHVPSMNCFSTSIEGWAIQPILNGLRSKYMYIGDERDMHREPHSYCP